MRTIMMLRMLKHPIITWMPTEHITVTHFIAKNIVMMLIFIAIVARRGIEIQYGHEAPIGQQGITAGGNPEQILRIAQIEAEAEDDEIDLIYFGQAVGCPHRKLQPWIAREPILDGAG